jgi:putative molybdopterin biosynthesis protein
MFRKLVSLDEAKRMLLDKFSSDPLGVERVPLSQAYDRVLAEDVVASIDVPPFDRSTVDGYAVRALDTFGADEDMAKTLRFCGSTSVGEPPRVVVERGTTVETVTGAPLPKGADAAVMLEHTSRKDDTVFVYRPVSLGENVMRASSDIKKGEILLESGRRLTPREVGVLAAVGSTEVTVYKRPRVAVLSTGAEIMELGRPLSPGKVYDINAYALSAAVLECGGEPINLGIVPDERDRLKQVLERALGSADVVITSGGVSVGPKDIVPEVVNSLGEPGVLVSGVAVKPGKPVTIALIKGKPIFSLPGHPTSSLLMFHLIVRPVISSMTGRPEDSPIFLKARTATKLFSARGRRTFVMVKLIRDEAGELLASPVPLGLSGAITTLAKAEGFIEIHETQQFIDAGEEVTVHLFQPRQN